MKYDLPQAIRFERSAVDAVTAGAEFVTQVNFHRRGPGTEPAVKVKGTRDEILAAVSRLAALTAKRAFGYSTADGRVSEVGNKGRLKTGQANQWDRVCCEGDPLWTVLPSPPKPKAKKAEPRRKLVRGYSEHWDSTSGR